MLYAAVVIGALRVNCITPKFEVPDFIKNTDLKVTREKSFGLENLKFPLKELQFAMLLKIWQSMAYTVYHAPISVKPGRVAQSVGHLTRKSGVLGSIPGLAT